MTPVKRPPRSPKVLRLLALVREYREAEDRLGPGDADPALVAACRRLARRVDAAVEDLYGVRLDPPGFPVEVVRRPTVRPCAVPGCCRSVPNHLLMCGPHWRLVPARVARGVTAAYRLWIIGGLPLAGLRAEQARAVAAVANAKGGAA
jgi:hypothetical protein